jgi:hypothetical protein
MMPRVALERLPEWVNADAALVRRGRYRSTILLVEVGDTAWPARLKLALERIRREDLNGLPEGGD